MFEGGETWERGHLSVKQQVISYLTCIEITFCIFFNFASGVKVFNFSIQFNKQLAVLAESF